MRLLRVCSGVRRPINRVTSGSRCIAFSGSRSSIVNSRSNRRLVWQMRRGDSTGSRLSNVLLALKILDDSGDVIRLLPGHTSPLAQEVQASSVAALYVRAATSRFLIGTRDALSSQPRSQAEGITSTQR